MARVGFADLRRHMGSGADITTGLAHWWHPSRVLNANDQVGTLHGTMRGGLVATAEGWDMGTADSQYVDLAGPIPNGVTYSVVMWIRPNIPAIAANAVGGWLLSDRAASGDGIDMQVLILKSPINLYLHSRIVGGSFVEASVVPADGVWQHVAMVVDNVAGTLSAYLQAVAATPVALGGVPSDASIVNARIGADSWNRTPSAGLKYHGAIDNVRIYVGRAIDTDTVTALYLRGRTA